MKLSLKWLGEFVDLSGIDPDEVAAQLTQKVAPIEEIERVGEALRDVKVAHVLKAEKHPDADRLKVCVVDTGDEHIDVVCGAPNVAAGQRIAYAPVGAVLPGNFKLEKRKIRGVVSHGMICSEKEMELGDSHDGILVLDPEAPLGTPLVEHLGIDDIVLDVDNKSVTHRADLWGHYGFARELSSAFGRPLRLLEVDKRLQADPDAFDIRREDEEGCPQYLGLLIENVSGEAESPGWLCQRLTAAGMRPVNLLVDLSNYVMLETGQPTHPFDQDTLSGGIRVRRAQDGEKLRTLDDVERSLTKEDVVIADHERAVAIAGIMGGGPTEVSATTTRVLLESAAFDAIRVRRTSARLSLRTDALARFEKFLDPTLPELAIRRYAHLLTQLCPDAKIHPRFAQSGTVTIEPRHVTLRPPRARLKLGLDASREEMSDRLTSVGFEVRGDDQQLEVRVPTFRAGRDVEIEDDLIEEVGRLCGYERIASELPQVRCTPPGRDPVKSLERQVAAVFTAEAGFTEVLSYSFATDQQRQRYHSDDEQFLALEHPISKEAGVLRRSLVPGILEHAAHNQLHREEVRIVEVGRAYLPEHGKDGIPEERHELVAVRMERGADPESLVLRMRSDLEAALRRLGRPWQGRAPSESLPPFAHPGRSVELVGGTQRIGVLAQLHPEVARTFEIEWPVAMAWLDLGRLSEIACQVPQVEPLPQFPSAFRDISVVAPATETIEVIEKEIRSAGKKRLHGVRLFDVYQGKGIPDGHRSLAFRLEYRDPDKTLTDQEVQKAHDRIVKRLEQKNIRQRG